MTKRQQAARVRQDQPFKGRQSTAEVILWAIRSYLMFPISYRGIELMLLDRSVLVDHSTIFRWIQVYAAELEKRIRPYLRLSNGSWRVDETWILSANSGAAVLHYGAPMSLHLEPIGEIPTDTVRIVRAAFPKGILVTRLRDAFSELYKDEDFHKFYPSRGQPGLTPWRLALVTVFQFVEHLSDRQAADAVRARIDWKYALGLELTDPGFHFSVLTEFRRRRVAGVQLA